MNRLAPVAGALATILTLPGLASAASLDARLGVTTRNADGLDETIFSPSFRTGLGLTDDSSIELQLGLATSNADTDLGVAVGNLVISGFHQVSGGFRLGFGVAAPSASTGARADLLRAAATTRGYHDPWSWLSESMSLVSSWQLRAGEENAIIFDFDLATIFPMDTRSEEGAAIAWQLATTLQLALSNAITTGLVLTASNPSRLFFRATESTVQWTFDPYLDLGSGRMSLRAQLTLPLTDPLKNLMDWGLELGLRIGI